MRPKIYLFGDSITEDSFSEGGWGASLANHFCRTVDVVLRGYSGYNTRWVLKVLDKVFPATQVGDGGIDGAPIAVTVFFGANDASLPDRYSAFQHVPLDEFKQNLHSIVSFIKNLSIGEVIGRKQWPTTVVLLITPPPIDEDGRIKHPYAENPEGLPERTNEAAGEYARACITVAGECAIPVIDLWTKMQQRPGWQKDYLWYQKLLICYLIFTDIILAQEFLSKVAFRRYKIIPRSLIDLHARCGKDEKMRVEFCNKLGNMVMDGLHLTRSGNQVVFEEVVKKLKDEGLSLESIPIDLPPIADIDHNDPLKAFQLKAFQL
ncbi:hypothetical protein Lal_00026185 [Lupinus albus]|nr:hypothetical protein Lal_00026185 [Lupinus albus]